jgi:hypothetical protein
VKPTLFDDDKRNVCVRRGVCIRLLRAIPAPSKELQTYCTTELKGRLRWGISWTSRRKTPVVASRTSTRCVRGAHLSLKRPISTTLLYFVYPFDLSLEEYKEGSGLAAAPTCARRKPLVPCGILGVKRLICKKVASLFYPFKASINSRSVCALGTDLRCGKGRMFEHSALAPKPLPTPIRLKTFRLAD